MQASAPVTGMDTVLGDDHLIDDITQHTAPDAIAMPRLEGQDRREAQSAAILVALALGLAGFLLVLLGGWLVEALVDALSSGQPDLRPQTHAAAATVGVTIVLWRLVHAAAKGL